MLDNTESSSSFVLVSDELSANEDEVESSFSLISDIIDEGSSFLSFCDDVLGDIELVPALRCYKHSRNVKLNRLLDVAVILSFALVTGLGIGNFLGHTTGCTASRPLTNKFQCPADPGLILEASFIHGICNSVREEKQHSDCTKHVVKTGVVNYSNVEIRHHQKQIDKHDSVISKDRNEIIRNPVFPKNVSRESIASVNEHPILKYSLAHTSGNLVQNFKFDRNFKIYVNEFQGLHFQMSKESTYSDLLNILNNGIADIVRKMQNLVSAMVNDDNFKSRDLQTLEEMYEIFHHSVKEKALELNGFVMSGFFEDTASGRKQFMKMSYTIIKSVDKLLENSFFKVLVKENYPLNSRLKKMSDIGFGIIKELEKKWSYRKKKLLGYVKEKEDMKRVGNGNNYIGIIKYKKHHDKFKKQKFDTQNYNLKHDYSSFHFKPKKHFDKKKF